MSKAGTQVKLHTRQTMAALSDASLRLKKEVTEDEKEEYSALQGIIHDINNDEDYMLAG